MVDASEDFHELIQLFRFLKQNMLLNDRLDKHCSGGFFMLIFRRGGVSLNTQIIAISNQKGGVALIGMILVPQLNRLFG